MGDRAQIVIRENGKELYLYTHWTGDRVLEDVRDGLLCAIKNGREDDTAYLTRIVFNHMQAKRTREGGRVPSPVDESTGFGIYMGPCDSNYDYLAVIQPKEGRIYLAEECQQPLQEVPGTSLTFEQFTSPDWTPDWTRETWEAQSQA